MFRRATVASSSNRQPPLPHQHRPTAAVQSNGAFATPRHGGTSGRTSNGRRLSGTAETLSVPTDRGINSATSHSDRSSSNSNSQTRSDTVGGGHSPIPHANHSEDRLSSRTSPASTVETKAPTYTQGYSKSLFVDKSIVEDYKCCICFEIARNPYDIPCGHTVCQYCMDQFLKASANAHRPGISARPPSLQCPQCRTAFNEFPLRVSYITQRKIAAMTIKCEFSENGCTWQGPIGDNDRNRLSHLEQCPRRPVTCPRCTKVVPFAELDQHKANACNERLVQCSHCDQSMKQSELKAHTQNEIGCQKFVLCPYSCIWEGFHVEGSDRVKSGDQLDRLRVQRGFGAVTAIYGDDLAAHKQICPLQPMLCSICNQQVIRNKLEQHMAASMPLHMSTLVSQVTSMKAEMSSIKTIKAEVSKLAAELIISRAENRQLRMEMSKLMKLNDSNDDHIETEKSRKGKWFG